ncbi:MAG TPA: Flp family type IVb pilin [Candidatus Dormibacteraeota bacterium]|nr:Flp family type IVb pilin [Candidatus Dormibacteraeota bacterium]
MRQAFYQLLEDDAAATLVEYALVIALVGVAAIVALKKLDRRLVHVFTLIRASIKKG